MLDLNFGKRCIIIGACNSPEINICNFIKKTDYIICADGGYDIAKNYGIIPHLCIGDLDSIDSDTNILMHTKIIKFPRDKNSTDLMLCAQKAVNLGFKDILILAATGERLDHSLANLSVLLYLSKKRIRACIIDKLNNIRILNRGSIYFYNKLGTYVSVLPFSTSNCIVKYEGFKYSNNQITKLFSESTRGISNCIISNKACVKVLNGPAIIVVNIQD